MEAPEILKHRDIWVISDTHFNHENILKFTDNEGKLVRDFTSLEEMNETMVDKWNSVVKPGDKVYHLGDVFFGEQAWFKKMWPRLKGAKRLIVGNHDDIIQDHLDKFLTTSKHDGHPLLYSAQSYLKLQLKELGRTLVLFHYPIAEWDGCHKGYYHLHGHIHDRMADIGGRILNVGKGDYIASEYLGSEILDFNNRLIIPGFSDSHIHLTAYSKLNMYPTLADASSIEEFGQKN